MCTLAAHHSHVLVPVAYIQSGWTSLRFAVEEEYGFGIQSLLHNKANTEIGDVVRG